MNKLFYYSWKQHLKNNKIAKFGGKMLWITKNIVRRSLRILYTVFRAEKPTIFGSNMAGFSVRNTNIYTKSQGYIFPVITTFRQQNL